MRWPAPGPSAVGKAFWRACAGLWLVLLGCLAPAAPGQAAGEQRIPPTLMLEQGADALRGPLPGLQWADLEGQATLAQVLAGQGAFTPLQPDRIHALGARGALWFHLRLARPAGSHIDWLAEIPLPPLDNVTLYQQDRSGAWYGHAAGDRLAVASWPQPGRFPVFQLELPPGEVRDVYFRVQHNARANIPLRIATVTDQGLRMQMAYLGLGLVLGALLLLIAACLVQSWVFRDRAFFGYAAYASTIALAMAAFTGAAGHLLWPHSGFVADAAQGGLGLLSAAAAILFVRDLCGIAAHRPRLAALARWTALAVPLVLAAYVAIDRPPATLILGGYLALACLLNVLIAWYAWRRGDKPSFWVLAAYVPLVIAVVLTLMRVFGIAPTSWANQYGLVAAMAVQVPLLLVALGIHSRERHGARIRELALSSQDALTGLLAAHLFHDRLRQILARNQRDGESAAVLFIDLVNYPRIREQHGSAIAEQSLLRSVIKLRRMLREADTLSRIGEARFGLILERMASRVTVLDRAARMVASGMIPIKGLKPEVALRFHVAAALLDEVRLEQPQLSAGLAQLLDSMPQATRRPIRFLGSAPAEAESGNESVRPGDDSALPLAEGA